jgi:predicted nucleotidyltransferase
MANYVDDVRSELDELTKIIVETVPVDQVYLFGSYAYGTPHKDSDLDLYIVLKDSAPMRELDAMDAVSLAICRTQKRPVDLLALKRNRFLDRKTDATLERKIARESQRHTHRAREHIGRHKPRNGHQLPGDEERRDQNARFPVPVFFPHAAPPNKKAPPAMRKGFLYRRLRGISPGVHSSLRRHYPDQV